MVMHKTKTVEVVDVPSHLLPFNLVCFLCRFSKPVCGLGYGCRAPVQLLQQHLTAASQQELASHLVCRMWSLYINLKDMFTI